VTQEMTVVVDERWERQLTVTGLGLVFLVVHATFWIAGTVRVRHLLYAILGSYVTLLVYQLDMLARAF